MLVYYCYCYWNFFYYIFVLLLKVKTMFFRICCWVLPVVPRCSDPGQPGLADGLDSERWSGRSSHWLFPETLCCCQSAGHTQRNPPAGQRTSVSPFLFVCSWAGKAAWVESCLHQPECFHCLKGVSRTLVMTVCVVGTKTLHLWEFLTSVYPSYCSNVTPTKLFNFFPVIDNSD